MTAERAKFRSRFFHLKPPWWFCCGWWSPWCVLDTVLHELHIEWRWVCDKHDAAITDEPS
jgi:hypothetical protein